MRVVACHARLHLVIITFNSMNKYVRFDLHFSSESLYFEIIILIFVSFILYSM